MPATKKLSPAWSFYINKELLYKKEKKKHDRDKAQWLNSIRRFFHNLTCLFQRHQFVKCRLLFRNQVQKERDKFLVVCLHVPHHVTISFQEWMDPGFVFSKPPPLTSTLRVSFDSSCHKNRKALGTQKIHLPQVKVKISPKLHHRKPVFCSISCSSFDEFQFLLSCIWCFFKKTFSLFKGAKEQFL